MPSYTEENKKAWVEAALGQACAMAGDIDPARHVRCYYEMDFLGAAVTANSRESNSYTPRIRQAYFAYDDDNWHGHFSAARCGACSPKTG